MRTAGAHEFLADVNAFLELVSLQRFIHMPSLTTAIPAMTKCNPNAGIQYGKTKEKVLIVA